MVQSAVIMPSRWQDGPRKGWVKLHREALESSVFSDLFIWAVWSWCLMKASHKGYKLPFNGIDLDIRPGEFITGRTQAISELPRSMTAQRYKTALKYLKSTHRLTIKTSNKFSIIRVNNWDNYQGDNQQTKQPLTSKQPASNQQLTTYKNDKNDKNNILKKEKVKKEKEQPGVRKLQSPYPTLYQQLLDVYKFKSRSSH